MIHVYIDYPVPHMTIHQNPDCKFIRPFAKPNQRVSKIHLDTLSSELRRFADKDYRFASAADLNDILLELDMYDPEFEQAIAKHVLRLIARHYTPLRGIEPTVHC